MSLDAMSLKLVGITGNKITLFTTDHSEGIFAQLKTFLFDRLISTEHPMPM